MKSDHRHELKTNELAEWIANFPQWAKENLKMIIGVSAVVVIALSLAFFHWYRKNVESIREQVELTKLITRISLSKRQTLNDRARGVDTSYMLIQVADNLQSAAQSVNDNQMAALALIKHAEALRTALHYRQGTVSRPELEAAINRAKAGYNEALEQASPNASLMATAKFGLGLCEEELGNFENAKQIYRELAINTGFEGTIAAVQAKQRLETMTDYKQKVVFKASPKPAPSEIKQPKAEETQPPAELKQPQLELTQPPIKPEVPDTNLPDTNLPDTNLPGQ